MSALDEQLAELLERWEAALDSGMPLTPEEICREQPQTLDAFRSLLTKIGAVNAVLVNQQPIDNSAELAGPRDGGRYRVNCFHDRGGQAMIFAAEDTELRRTVALKWMPPLSAIDATERDRFVFEAELVAKLDHPGIVPIYGLGTDENGQPYYAMRMIHGENLSSAAKSFHSDQHASVAARNIAFRRLVQHFASVCTTIEYAHARGIIHRDLKPNNVRIGTFGETIVLDWGLAKLLDQTVDPEETLVSDHLLSAQHSLQRTLPGAVMGSPAYMSPEQAAGLSHSVGPATDVYGLGATLYVVLCGRPPFQGNSVNEVLNLVKAGKFSPPRMIEPSVPKALEAVCLKAMALKPEERYATVHELTADIERWLADEAVSAWREPWPVRARRWASRHRTLTAVIAATTIFALLATAGGSVLLERKNRELFAANQVATANFQQSHESLLNVVEMAVNGRTVGDNAALLPVRLEILDHAIENARGLKGRAPDDQRTTLELALLLAARSEVESLLGLPQTSNSLSEALSLVEKLRDDHSADVRHARSLVRYLSARTQIAPSVPVQRDDLLEQACRDLASLVESQQVGSIVGKFGRNHDPALLLAAAAIELRRDSAERTAWVELAERQLAAPRQADAENELISQSVRGRMWYDEALRGFDAGDLARVRRGCHLSVAGFQRSLAAAGNDEFASSVRWFLSESRMLEARLMVVEGSEDAAAAALTKLCEEQRQLLSSIAATSAELRVSWSGILPGLFEDGEVAKKDPLVMVRLQLTEHYLELVKLQRTLEIDSAEALEHAETLLRTFEPGNDLANIATVRLAGLQVSLAEELLTPDTENRSRHWAESAIELVQVLAKLEQIDAKSGLAGLQVYRSLSETIAADEYRLSAVATLCRAYLILSELADRPAEAVQWLHRTDGLRDKLSSPSSPAEMRRLAAQCALRLADASVSDALSREAAWNTALEASVQLDKLRQFDPDFVPQQLYQNAGVVLANAALNWVGELLQQRPLPRNQVIKVCELATATLVRLREIRGSSTVEETNLLKRLDQARRDAQ